MDVSVGVDRVFIDRISGLPPCRLPFGIPIVLLRTDLFGHSLHPRPLIKQYRISAPWCNFGDPDSAVLLCRRAMPGQL